MATEERDPEEAGGRSSPEERADHHPGTDTDLKPASRIPEHGHEHGHLVEAGNQDEATRKPAPEQAHHTDTNCQPACLEDEPKRPSLDQLVLGGKVIMVPSDSSLERALHAVNTLGGAGTPTFITVEAGEQLCSSPLEVKVPNVTIKGLSKTDKLTGAVTRATVVGVWRLCRGSSGSMQDLTCVNQDWDTALFSMMDGAWQISRCKLLCGADPTGIAGVRSIQKHGGYRLIFLSLYCHGGSMHVKDSAIGGIDGHQPAFGGLVCSNDSACRLEACTVAHCTGTALELRDTSRLALISCQIMRNGAVFAAGFPNSATLMASKNAFQHNQRMWWRAPPHNIEDQLDNVDITGYLIQLYPDV